ncbi:neutral zinc metallopeptidase [Kribbella sp. NPDC023855]|uniref:neutral zinc metallopeptidase n=1 Tax=Kribbella sp. NPDC023855 TaxID=3154698 RepID=UPI0033ED0451
MSNQQWGPLPGQPPQYPPPQQPWGAPAPTGQYSGPPGQYPGPAGSYSGPSGPYSGPPGPPGPPAPPQYWGPQHQQPFGWGQLPPPPKKKRGVAVVFGILGGLLVLGVAGVAIASYVQKNDEPTVTRPAVVPTTEGPGPFPTPTKATLPTAVPTATATTRRPTVPVPTRTTPPPKPQLTANQVVTANRLYKTGAQRAVGCRESKGGLATASKASAYYRTIKLCLDRAWPRHVVAAGYEFRTPGMLVFAGRATSPCGSTTDGRSFYCPSNHVIYMEVSGDMRAYRQLPTFGRALATHTVAHEYGHAVQGMTRILRANYALQYDVSGAKKLELNRRMELQASCLGDVFLGTNKGSYGLNGQLYAQWLYIVNYSGDENARGGPRDHGSRASHGYWARRGFAARNPAFCNTFVAPANKVS